MDTIELEYRVALRDYLTAYEHHWRSRRLGSRENILTGVVGLAVACIVAFVIRPWWWTLVVAIPSAVLIALPWIRRLRYGNYFKREPKFQDSANVTFSETGIQFQGPGVDSTLEWSWYSKYSDSPGYFLLYYGRDAFSIIPKAAFSSPEIESAFRALLDSKLSRTTRTDIA